MVILDGRMMIDKDRTHRYLKDTLEFPDWYGKNLDGLWDLLTDYYSDEKIYLINEAEMLKYLGDYGEKIINVFQDLNEEFNQEIFKILF